MPIVDWMRDKGCEPTSKAVLLATLGLEPSSGGVTSKPILPFNAILIGFGWFTEDEVQEKCEKAVSSKLLFLRLIPALTSPCRNEFDRRNKISSTRSELDLLLNVPATVGESGNDNEFDFVVANGGARGLEVGLNVGIPKAEPRLLPLCEFAAIC